MQNLDSINFAVFIPTKHMELKTYAKWITHKKQIYKIEMDTNNFIKLLSEIGILSYPPNILKHEIKEQSQENLKHIMQRVIEEANKPKFPSRQPARI